VSRELVLLEEGIMRSLDGASIHAKLVVVESSGGKYPEGDQYEAVVSVDLVTDWGPYSGLDDEAFQPDALRRGSPVFHLSTYSDDTMEVRFLDLGRWTAEEIEEARRRARRIMEVLNWRDDERGVTDKSPPPT